MDPHDALRQVKSFKLLQNFAPKKLI